MTTIRAFFTPNKGNFFPIFEKGQGRTPPSPFPLLVTRQYTSGGGADEVLVRLQLINQIIKDTNLMCTSFGVKHPQTFRET